MKSINGTKKNLTVTLGNNSSASVPVTPGDDCKVPGTSLANLSQQTLEPIYMAVHILLSLKNCMQWMTVGLLSKGQSLLALNYGQ